ncbi:hypothetical protein ACOJIU_09375 [Carnobacterium maltaromaticum]|uniref:hypothetical protein n=1 Tax=Carnobacterium maltaromaticum TaxID=2751 RepID=UPI003B9829C4
MKKKNWLILLIGLVVIIGIGGKIYMDNQKEKAVQQQEKNKLEAEKMSVVALKNMFTDIKSVEIEKTGFNEMTGSYGMFVKMTNTKNESVTFSYSFWVKSNEIGYYSVKNEQVQVEGKTKDIIKVTYSNGESEEI